MGIGLPALVLSIAVGLNIGTPERRTWAAIAAAGLVYALFGFFQGGWEQLFVPLLGLSAAILLTRFGLLPLAVMWFVGASLRTTPMTTSLSDWFAPSMLTVVVVLLAITIWCFHHALGGRRLLKADLLDA